MTLLVSQTIWLNAMLMVINELGRQKVKVKGKAVPIQA
jgi:hypothetical protein